MGQMTPSELNDAFLKVLEQDPEEQKTKLYAYIRACNYFMRNTTDEEINIYLEELNKTCPTCGAIRKLDDSE